LKNLNNFSNNLFLSDLKILKIIRNLKFHFTTVDVETEPPQTGSKCDDISMKKENLRSKILELMDLESENDCDSDLDENDEEIEKEVEAETTSEMPVTVAADSDEETTTTTTTPTVIPSNGVCSSEVKLCDDDENCVEKDDDDYDCVKK
jgi:hypothetical protein